MSKVGLGFVSVLTLAIASGCARGGAHAKGEVHPAPGPQLPVAGNSALVQPTAAGVSIADVAERVLPSVVTISTTVSQRQPMMFPFFGGPTERQAQGRKFDTSPSGAAVLSANAPVPSLVWQVFVERPVAEVFGPLWSAALRGVLLLVLGLAAVFLAGVAARRRVTVPSTW